MNIKVIKESQEKNIILMISTVELEEEETSRKMATVKETGAVINKFTRRREMLIQFQKNIQEKNNPSNNTIRDPIVNKNHTNKGQTIDMKKEELQKNTKNIDKNINSHTNNQLKNKLKEKLEKLTKVVGVQEVIEGAEVEETEVVEVEEAEEIEIEGIEEISDTREKKMILLKKKKL